MQIELKDYPVFMKIGCFEQERLAGQEVLVSLNARVAVRHSSSLCLEETTDYGEMIATIDSQLRNQEIDLIESAVLALGRALLAEFLQIERLDLTIEKTILPSGLAKGARVKVSESFSRESAGSEG